MASLLRKLGAGLGLVGATYYGKVGYDMYEASVDAGAIESQYKTYQSELSRAEAQITKDMALMEELQTKVKELQQGRAKWEAKVIEAQTALDRARTGLSVCESEASEASQGVKDAHDRVDQAEAARVKARESAEVSLAALSEARQLVEETKRMYNPLNHPQVKSLLNQR
ncbi:hypothetical protein ACKKBG_A20910 [Auxenochlorella protothecoides x Auxenochlorella symbiontica]